jgi:hypothetical protein
MQQHDVEVGVRRSVAAAIAADREKRSALLVAEEGTEPLVEFGVRERRCHAPRF